MVRLSDRARFELDLELPLECWNVEDLDEDLANLLRLTYMAGYVSATRDAKSGKMGRLIKRVNQLQSRHAKTA